MTDPAKSKSVKAGDITYFFDIKETKQGKSFLVITMSPSKGEGEERERPSMVVFPEQARMFLSATQDMIKDLYVDK